MFIFIRDISIVVVCDANDATGYGRRIPELSNAGAPLNTKQDTTSTPV